MARRVTACQSLTPFAATALLSSGNDACWNQVARDQLEIFHDDLSTSLSHPHYEKTVQGFGASGLLLDDPATIKQVLQKAQNLSRSGRPALINAILGKSDFRKGAISM